MPQDMGGLPINLPQTFDTALETTFSATGTDDWTILTLNLLPGAYIITTNLTFTPTASAQTPNFSLKTGVPIFGPNTNPGTFLAVTSVTTSAAGNHHCLALSAFSVLLVPTAVSVVVRPQVASGISMLATTATVATPGATRLSAMRVG